MKIELDLNEVSNLTIKQLVADGLVKLESFKTDRIIRILRSSEIATSRICANSLLGRSDLSPNSKKAIFEDGINEGYLFMMNTKQYGKAAFSNLFSAIDLFDIHVSIRLKKQVKEWYMEYIKSCNYTATTNCIHPQNVPNWLIKMMQNDYNGIQYRIAMYNAGNWMQYNKNEPDSRAEVRRVHAMRFGTTKDQAIHDNAYSLRLKAEKEHNIKL